MADCRQIKLLIVEDNRTKAHLFAELISQSAPDHFKLLFADCLAAAMRRLAVGDIGAVLLDLALPDAARLEAVTVLQACYPQVSITVVLDRDDQCLAHQAIARGAQACLSKCELSCQFHVYTLRYALACKQAEDVLNAFPGHHQDLRSFPINLPPLRNRVVERPTR